MEPVLAAVRGRRSGRHASRLHPAGDPRGRRRQEQQDREAGEHEEGQRDRLGVRGADLVAELVDEASECLRLLSGRNHRVHTAICLVTPKEAYRQRLVETRVRFKRLSEDDIETYLASGEWRGKAGGYAAQGIAGSFIVKIAGSYSNVVGLPLYEVTTLLSGEGYPIRLGWLNPV